MKLLRNQLLLAALLFLLSPLSASALTVELPDGYVGHTRLLPVIVHRLFPPYLGQHVYLRPMRSQPAEVLVAPAPW